MSHHFFILSPADNPVYSTVHQSMKPAPPQTNPLASNLPSWSTSAFAGTLTALSGATSPAYTAGAGASSGARGGGQDRHVIQMVAYASLDILEEVERKDSAMYLKAFDKHNEWTVSAFITPGNSKFLLLHEAKNDDGIKAFFVDVWELYVKTLMNPFHTAYTPIRSQIFNSKVLASAKKHL